MKLELAIPVAWTTTRSVRDRRETIVVDGGLVIDIDEPVAGADAMALLEASVARDPIAGTTIDRAGHVTAHTTEGVPFSLSSIKLRDATNTTVEGRLIALYNFGDVLATVRCRLTGRDALVAFGSAMEPLFASARLDRGTAAPRIDDLLR